MSALPPLPGDPAAVRHLAQRLLTSAQRLAALAAVLARLRDRATWEGTAGDAFGARLHDVPPVLDAVAQRLGGAAAPLRALADAMEEAQAVIGAAVREDADAEHAYAVLEDRAFALVHTGSGEDSPELLLVRHLQRDQVEVRTLARARHTAAVERFREADRRCARALRVLSVDGIADSLTYRAVVGAGSVGHGVASLGTVATAVPWLRPVAAVGEGVGLAADTALLLAYREGDAAALAAGAALGATGAAGGVLRRGAVQGAQRSTTGVTVTRGLTAQERLRLGAVAEVRARRDDLRRRFAAAPDRGTPSALLGGPAVRPPRAPSPAGAAAVRAAVSGRVVRARALAGARADAAFRDDWRLATANGVSAQRMYTAGATLEVATRAGKGAVGVAGGAPDGTARAADGTARAPDGTARAPDATARSPDGSARAPDGTARAPDGTARAPDGTARAPDEPVRSPDPAARAPDGTARSPDGTGR